MTKLLQVAVPVVLAILSLMPRVDAPTHAGMYMQINVKTIQEDVSSLWVSTQYPSECKCFRFQILQLVAIYPQIYCCLTGICK